MKRRRWMTVDEFEERFDNTNSLYLTVEMSFRLRECSEIAWGIFVERYGLCYQYDCDECPFALMGGECKDKNSLWQAVLGSKGKQGVIVAEEMLRYCLQALLYLEPEKAGEFIEGGI